MSLSLSGSQFPYDLVEVNSICFWVPLLPRLMDVKVLLEVYTVDTVVCSVTLLKVEVPPCALLGELPAHTTTAAGSGPLQ